MSPDQKRSLFEALIFASPEPISVKQLNKTLALKGEGAPKFTDAEADKYFDNLNAEYEKSGRSFRLHRWAGGFRHATLPEYSTYIQSLFDGDSTRRLTKSLMETVAVVAYRQPVSKPEIDFVRGVDSSYTIRRLLELGFIEVIGRAEGVGNPLLYGTTPFFLDQFGIDSIHDLPELKELEELLKDPEIRAEQKLYLLDGAAQNATHEEESEEEEEEASVSEETDAGQDADEEE